MVRVQTADRTSADVGHTTLIEMWCEQGEWRFGPGGDVLLRRRAPVAGWDQAVVAVKSK
jgi:hypothetical protein